MKSFLSEIAVIDIVAFVWFLACWGGYNWFASHGRHGRGSLVGASHGYRLQWARQLLLRENRVADSSLIGNLMSSVSFYANTTIYVIAGLMALWSTLDQTMGIFSELPFARHSARALWELRLVLLIFVFVFAYFKFTWALREFNLLSIMIGAAPDAKAVLASDDRQESYAQRMAAVNSMAGEEFNRGVRSYYFGLAALAWFIQPWLFIGVSTLVVVVLYRRDYASPLLRIFQPD
ncbi:MAG: DUF599 domain-containing protein [Rhodocyclaceae bacterium]|nr:DUF599 domain-containing protein [Rhodocyclaceae bacterium]